MKEGRKEYCNWEGKKEGREGGKEGRKEGRTGCLFPSPLPLLSFFPSLPSPPLFPSSPSFLVKEVPLPVCPSFTSFLSFFLSSPRSFLEASFLPLLPSPPSFLPSPPFLPSFRPLLSFLPSFLSYEGTAVVVPPCVAGLDRMPQLGNSDPEEGADTNKFSEKHMYSRNEFSKKCQYSRNEFSKKCQYSKNEFSKKRVQ